MKKLCILLLASLMLATPAYARGGYHHGGNSYHHHFHYRPFRYAGDVAVGVLGAAAGFALADTIISSTRPRVVEVSQPRVYMAEPENKCYTVVSRKNGTVTRKCVSDTDDDIIYVD